MGNGPDVEGLRKKATTEPDPKLRAANQKKFKMFERLSIRQYLRRLAERGKVQKDPELREAYRRRLAMSDEEVAAMEERIKQFDGPNPPKLEGGWPARWDAQKLRRVLDPEYDERQAWILYPEHFKNPDEDE